MRKKQVAGALALCLAMWGGAAQAITIEFDYSLDTSSNHPPAKPGAFKL